MGDSTQRASRETLIGDALSEVLRVLDGAEKTPHTRELRAQARFYEQAMKHWTTVPPTFAQLDAMLELVVELHGKAMASHRTPGR